MSTFTRPISQPSPAARRQKVLVLGGTGFLGRSLCRQLTSAGEAIGGVTVATRDRASATHLRELPGLDIAVLDVFDLAQLGRLVEGHDAVVNLVAILHGDDAKFHRIHVDLVQTLVSVCRAKARPRVVHVSALGVRANAPSMYLRSKTEGESRLLAAGIDATVLRPSVLFGAHDRFLNLFGQLLKFAPIFPLACAHALFQPVWVDDVAAGIVRCLCFPESGQHVYECVGPQVYELIELVRLTGQWSGHPRLIIPLSSSMGKLQASIVEKLPGATMMSRDNLDSMREPNIANGLPGLQDLGIRATALEAVAPQYLRASA